MKGIVWLASYQKSGNTWFRIFLANLLADRPEPVDINALETTAFAAREVFDPVLGWDSTDLSDAEIYAARLAVQEVQAREEDRIYKVHEAFRHPRTGAPLFSHQATRAALYFLRNPLDVVVSASHHHGRDLDASIERLNDPTNCAGLAVGSQACQLLQPVNTWSAHVRSWVDEPDLAVRVLRYEDMLARPLEVFTAACAFTGFPTEPARVARALEHARFENVRAQEQVSGFREALERRTFFRQGKAGGWRAVLSPAQVSAIVQAHGEVMRRFGYLNADGTPA